jgi:hypothetical protein
MRLYNQFKQYSQKQKLQPIDKMMYVVSFVYPLTVAPQIYKVYTTHDVESLALASWLLYVLFQLVCVAYAVQRRLTPLIIEGVLWLVYYGLMVFAILYFG